MSSDWWWVIGATLTTIVFVVLPTIYAWYVLEAWIGAGEVSYAKRRFGSARRSIGSLTTSRRSAACR